MRFMLILFVLPFWACNSGGGSGPVPGQTCTPQPLQQGACYDKHNLLACERQSDGVFRWSDFLECGASGILNMSLMRSVECNCAGDRYENYREYLDVKGDCNCYGVMN